MPFKTSIAAKIFGLAGLLMALTICVATFLLYQVTHLTQELRFVSDQQIPLALSLAKVNEYGLRRRLAFERWYGALNSDTPDQEVLKEAKENYGIFTKSLEDEFLIAESLLSQQSTTDTHIAAIASLKTLLTEVKLAYPQVTERQQEALALQESQQHDRAQDLLSVLNDLQRQLQRQRRQLEDQIGAVVLSSSLEATQRQGQIFWLTILVTAGSLALGVVLSSLVTRGVVRPVHSLVAGLRTVEGGDLSVELPVRSSDEVGVLTTSFNYFVRELRSKEQLKKTFGRYIDPRVLERVILQPGITDATGGRRIMTVSFSDLAGMTSIGEQLTASNLVNVLNSYFSYQASAVQAHLGVVDKFIGDSVMAFWGPPFTDETSHPVLACKAAIAQLEALDLFRTKLPELVGLRKNIPVFDMRLGIGTGDVVVGNIGSENARSYTVIGDTVNFASRLEGANKAYGTRILINENVFMGAKAEIVVREIDFLVVKGKSEPERVFELLGMRDSVGESFKPLCDTFAAGLAAYRAQRLNEAEDAFRSCLSLRKGDSPSETFLTRIAHLREHPPGAEWDGVWRLTSK